MKSPSRGPKMARRQIRPRHKPQLTSPSHRLPSPPARDTARFWQETPPDQRPSWRNLVSPAALARIERNLRSPRPR